MTKPQNPLELLESDIDDLDDISDEDYGFILDQEGNLKSVFLPEDTSEIPDKVMEILELFEIDSIESLASPAVTLH